MEKNVTKNYRGLRASFEDLKVAIVYDKANSWGGAERVLLSLLKLFPNCYLYSSVYFERDASWVKEFKNKKFSNLNNIEFLRKRHRLIPYLMPMVFESFDFSNFDLVLSVTSEFAKGVITNNNVKHLSYILTPPRYLWSGYDEYFKNKYTKKMLSPVVDYLKKWDLSSSSRPDQIVSISKEVKKRVKKYYKRNSDIIYPPINSSFFVKTPKFIKDDYYLVVSRLVSYKRIDLVVSAFNRFKKKLIIVGVGPEEYKLKKMAFDNIVFMGKVSDVILKKLYLNAKAIICPQKEDFGLVSLEAQASGCPVIAYGFGGNSETVINHKTGILFYKQNSESLIDAIERADHQKFDFSELILNAKRFEEGQFLKKFSQKIESLIL